MSGASSHCGMGGHHERGGELPDVGGDGHLAHELAGRERLGCRSSRAPRTVVRRASCGRGSSVSSLERRVAHEELEQEPVELRLGQRVRPLHLDRVLRRQHEERARAAGARRPPTVTLRSCIASSSADCVLGVARLISSASTMCAKIGPALELEVPPAVGVLDDDVRADDVGRHQVRRELDAREATGRGSPASVRTRSVLPRPGTPSSSTWPPAKRRDQDAGRRSRRGRR